VAELASASQHATADSLLFGRYGRRLRGASRGFFSQEEVSVPYRSRFGSTRVESSKWTGRKHLVHVRDVRSLVCPGFALTRLQNLVSGVWLERRASVVAEASGRGLGSGGSIPPSVEMTSSAEPGWEQKRRTGNQQKAREEFLARGRRLGSRSVVTFTKVAGAAVLVVRAELA
jgi:hypothetical protein